MQIQPKATILIVEDEGIVAADIQDRLQRMGYAVCGIAANGTQAIQMAEALRPNLVLMDIVLKGALDGIQAGDLIRGRQQLPIIYLTANSDRETIERAKLTEPFGYLLKPFDERDLETTIEVGLYKHRMEAERLRLVRELQETLRQAKTLAGLLPICAGCKKIRDDQGFWQQVEHYLQAHSNAEFSHGLCPDCMERIYPDLAESMAEETEMNSSRKEE
ncbi:MAG: response regulator [Verrucomicrobiota bacterium]